MKTGGSVGSLEGKTKAHKMRKNPSRDQNGGVQSSEGETSSEWMMDDG